MEKKDLKNKADVLVLKLEELELSQRIIIEVIDDKFFNPY